MKMISLIITGISLILLGSSAFAGGIGACRTMVVKINNNTSETWTVTTPPVSYTTIRVGDKIKPGVPYQRELWTSGAHLGMVETTKIENPTGKKSFIVYWTRGACWFGRAKNTSDAGYIVNTKVDVQPVSVPRWSHTRTDVTISK